MIVTEEIIEAKNPTGAKVVVGDLTEKITLGAEASKVITMANFNKQRPVQHRIWWIS